MFKNMTIGKKVGWGFGVIVILLVVVATLSYTGIQGIVTSALGEVIEGNKLRGSMAQAEVDHLNWTNKLNAFLTDDSVTELAVQTDPHQCNFGKWYYSEDRKQAEVLVPQLKEVFAQLEKPHQCLHDSALEIKKVYRHPHSGLGQQLTDFWTDQMKWAGECSHNLALEGNLYAYQNRVQGIVQQCVSVVEACDKDVTIGDTTARQKRAMEIIKTMRYGPENTDYVWINDMHPNMVMHPFKPQLDGTSIAEVADPDGKKLFVEFVNKCKAEGAGFVTYKWPMPGSDKPVPKISYVALYKPWNWVVGTGVFVTDDDEKFLARLEQFASGKPFTFGMETDPAKCSFGKFLASEKTAELCAGFPELSRSLNACRGALREALRVG